MDLKILYQDKYLIAVEKPAGLNTEPDANGNRNLADELKKQLSKTQQLKFGPAIIHRLDRPVSGIVLFALTPTALKKMNKLFAERKVTKIYQAIVKGHPLPHQKKLKHYLFKDTINKKAIISNELKSEFIPVSLTYKIIEKHEQNSKLEIVLHSGKYHQIRAQLAAIGHPIIGDTLYGDNTTLIPKNTILLHASTLIFNHPIFNKVIKIISPPEF
jgi:RluA family pseudouridine synthase